MSVSSDLSGGVPLAAFVRDHDLALTRFAYLITGDRGRGEDLVQDVLLAMHRRFGRVLTLDDPMAYARRAIINAHVSWLRRRRVLEVPFERTLDLSAADDEGVAAEDDVLWTALGELPPRQRAVLVLRYYLGSSDREIAELLECREGSVRSLAARAFKTLRPVLRPTTCSLEVAW
jgi:RNA polymerase sigma-70 factor (sigma-E family)